MTVRKGLIAAALAAGMMGSAALADQSSSTSVQQPPAVAPSADLTVPTYLQTSGPTSKTPIMYWLDQTSVGKTLDDNNISITGFIEGGYFYDTNNPRLGFDAAK